MRKELLLLLAMLLPFTAWAEYKDVTVGDYSYTINIEEHYAYVRGGASDLTSVRIPSSITYDNATYTVVGIDDMAFYSRKNVSSVSLPSTLKWIGKEAFAGCNMTSLNIPNSINIIYSGAFAGCKALTTLSLPSKAITIQSQAFSGCSNLKAVELYAGSELQYEAFKNCTSLTSVVIPKNTTLGSEIFEGCTGLTKVTIWSSNTGEWTFSGCTSLTAVSFGSTVRTIDKGCFKGCTSLTSVVIRDQIETIGDGAFKDCSNLESITFGSGLKTLGKASDQAGIVQGCTKLSKVIIPDIASWCNVDIVHGDDIFKYGKLYSDETHEVNNLVIPEGVTTIKKHAFRNCANIQSIQFPNTLETICDYALYKCNALESVKFGSGLKTIGYMAFYLCPSFSKMIIPDLAAYCGITLDSNSKLFDYGKRIYSDEDTEITELVIPDGTKAINDYVFQKCEGITSLCIPSTVETIGTDAFRGSNALTVVIARNPEPVVLEANTFSNRSNATLYVPKASVDAYKAANRWKDFKFIIGYTVGDANGDGEVTITDAVEIVNYLLGNLSADFNQAAVDVNGDGEITIADAVEVVNIIMNGSASAPKMDMTTQSNKK